MRLSVETCEAPEAAVVVARGEIDLATVAGLRDAITDHISGGCTHLLLDLSDVKFIDSTGLGVLVGAGKRLHAAGGALALVCDNPRILRLLSLTGLTKTLDVHPTRQDALTAWGPAAS